MTMAKLKEQLDAAINPENKKSAASLIATQSGVKDSATWQLIERLQQESARQSARWRNRNSEDDADCDGMVADGDLQDRAGRFSDRADGKIRNMTKLDFKKWLQSHLLRCREHFTSTSAKPSAYLRAHGKRLILATILILTCLISPPAFDMHQDMPLDLLHLVLLGFVKYLIRATLNKASKDFKAQISAHIRSMGHAGIGDPFQAEFWIQHAGSLVGKVHISQGTQVIRWLMSRALIRILRH